MKEPKTLAEMSCDAVVGNTVDGIKCPQCECRDFRTYGGSNGTTSRFRYKECRHCGHRVLTASKTVERIIRDVAAHADEAEDCGGESVLRLLG